MAHNAQNKHLHNHLSCWWHSTWTDSEQIYQYKSCNSFREGAMIHLHLLGWLSQRRVYRWSNIVLKYETSVFFCNKNLSSAFSNSFVTLQFVPKYLLSFWVKSKVQGLWCTVSPTVKKNRSYLQIKCFVFMRSVVFSTLWRNTAGISKISCVQLISHSYWKSFKIRHR